LVYHQAISVDRSNVHKEAEMHLRRCFVALAFALLVLVAPTALAADGAEPTAPEAPAAQPAPAEPAAPLSQEPAAPQSPGGEPDLGAGDLFMPAPDPASGCTAEIYCINTPPVTVSCSSGTPGTCQSYYGGCGTVSCNGQVKKCPGSCVGDHHCFSYCGFSEGVCEWGCCNCL
jgi:hypothetical protein